MIPLETAERTTAPDGQPAARQPAWRHDFPIDSPQDQYLARRDFTRFLMAASAAFGVGQLGVAVWNLLRGRPAPGATQAIVRVDELAVGAVRLFQYPSAGGPCLLLRPDEQTFVAFGQKCTHLGCAVVPDADGRRLRCPCHNGWFDAATGRPLAGPPRRPLPRIALETRDGVVRAVGVEDQLI
jgi:Rieske Fe-S protein